MTYKPRRREIKMNLPNSFRLLAFLAAAILISDVQCVKVVNQNHSKVTVKVGEQVDLLCRTDSTIRACNYRSPQGTTNSFWKGANYENGRIVENGETEFDCAIKITNVQESDHGRWECVISASSGASASSVSAYVDVTVAVAPAVVEIHIEGITAPEQYQVKMDAPLDEGTPIECAAKGARPEPEFKWYLGNDVLKAEISSRVENEEKDGKSDYISILKYYPDPKHNGQTLRCEVSHMAYSDVQLETQENVADVRLVVLYPPKPNAEDLVFYDLNEGDQNQVRIKFFANPEPREGEWTLGGLEEPLVVGSESVNKKYKSGLYEKGDSPGEWVVVLTINNLSVDDAGKQNTLSITNDEGTTHYHFRLELGSQPPPGSSSSLAVGLVILILILIILLVLVVVARAKGLFCFAAAKGGDENDEEKQAFESAEKGEATSGGATNNAIVKEPSNKAAAPGAGGDMGGSNQRTTGNNSSSSPDKKKTTSGPGGVQEEVVEVIEANSKVSSDKEEKKSNGAHTPA